MVLKTDSAPPARAASAEAWARAVAALAPAAYLQARSNPSLWITHADAYGYAWQIRALGSVPVGAVGSRPEVAGVGSILQAFHVLPSEVGPLVVGVAALVIYLLRRVRAERRQVWQFIVLGLAVVGAGALFVARGPVVALFNAGGTIDDRIDVWRQVIAWASQNGLQGWGWVGPWRVSISPGWRSRGDSNRSAWSSPCLPVWFQS